MNALPPGLRETRLPFGVIVIEKAKPNSEKVRRKLALWPAGLGQRPLLVMPAKFRGRQAADAPLPGTQKRVDWDQ